MINLDDAFVKDKGSRFRQHHEQDANAPGLPEQSRVRKEVREPILRAGKIVKLLMTENAIRKYAQT